MSTVGELIVAVTAFKDTTYSLSGLLERIRHGEIALPDIQRPFVWKPARVRDLFDSMYRGFPVGYLLFWSTGAEVGARRIGVVGDERAPQLLIVDGQQRLTSLYSVITGATIVREDYRESRIRIAFRPDSTSFEVADAAIERDPEWIADISEVFAGSFHSFVRQFLNRLAAHRGEALTDAEGDRVAEAIDRLKDLQSYPFKAIELDPTIDEEQVADVFVRINSEGVKLNQADFILTLMSVFWEKGRIELEAFARAAKKPSTSRASPFNHFIEPAPDELLRVAIGVAFRRGRLRHVYSLLRGKELDTGEVSPERREAQFARLREAHEATLDLRNWFEFLKCLTQAGFRSRRMISSDYAILYCYTLWLIGRRDFGVETKRLRETIARWFFMAHATGRYTSSPESQIESDLARLRPLETGDADHFCEVLDRVVADTFTADYWEITLPNRLETSAAKSPPLSAYWAALNLLDAELLFSELKVAHLLDPAVTPVRKIERHHLFPRAYLDSIDVTDLTEVNAIANMAFVDWKDNAEIAESPPAVYWPAMTAGMDADRLAMQRQWHALPLGWEQLDYAEFRDKRRKLIARVVRRGFDRLLAGTPPRPPATVAELIAAGESNVSEFKSTARYNRHTHQRDEKLEHVVVKTICGFMNAEGGSLLIGVGDDGAVLGLQEDYGTLGKNNRDGYELFLTQLVNTNLSGPAAALMRVSFHVINDQDVCRVDVAAAGKPAFAKPFSGKDHSEFWVRIGNQTQQLVGAKAIEYQDHHWG
jgi:hypothetical protein